MNSFFILVEEQRLLVQELTLALLEVFVLAFVAPLLVVMQHFELMRRPYRRHSVLQRQLILPFLER